MTTPSVVQMPQLVTVPDVEIVAAGTWDLSTGPATFTTEDLAAAIQAAQCPAVGSPILKLGHIDPRFDGEPAVGRVTNLRITSSGSKITGDLAGMPAWLGDVLPSAYPNRSIEGSYNFRCSVGHVHPFVITALALLGVTPPGVGVLSNLGDIAGLYGVAASGGEGPLWRLRFEKGNVMASDPAGPAPTVEDVRRSFYDNPAFPVTSWITEIQLSPPQLIVCDDASGQTSRIPFTMASDGTVSFGTPTPVFVQYVDAPTTVAASWGSRGESRKIAAKAKYTQADIDALGAKGQAFKNPDGTYSYPIADAEDLGNAIKAVGRGNADHDDIRKYIIGRAKDLGESDQIPDTWNSDGSLTTAAAGPDHGPFNGMHSHPHSAFGSQGGDATHDHWHSHAGDAVHDHHPAAATTAATVGGMPGTGTREAAEMQFTDEQLASLRTRLGKPDDAELTPDDIMAALAKPEPVAAAGKTAPVPEGTVLVDKDAFDGLQRRVAAGEKAREEQLRDRRDQTIAAAIRTGKIAPATRQKWTERWDKEPEDTEQVLASLEAGLIPLADIGTAGGPASPDVAASADADYDRLFPKDWQRQERQPAAS